MNDNNSSRRAFLATSSAAVAVWLGTDPHAFRTAVNAARTAARGRHVTFDTLTPEQAEDLESIASLIVPTDDLPGAREAKVIVFIDRSLGSFAVDQREPMLQGLAELNSGIAKRWPETPRFSTLPPDRQGQVIEEIEDGPFFGSVWFATMVGMFAPPSWGGNFNGAGYDVLGFEPRFIWQPPFGAYDAEVNR
jgi:gluconate 2-dehydrogenase gamma chain